MRTECMGVAIKDRNKIASERALQQLRNCLIIFGSCEVFATMEMLQAAVRGGRLRQVKREWNRFESQVRILIPQVQQLMLEMSTPKSAVQ